MVPVCRVFVSMGRSGAGPVRAAAVVSVDGVMVVVVCWCYTTVVMLLLLHQCCYASVVVVVHQYC